MQPTINIIGAGRLGKTIAKLIADNKVGFIQAICNTTLKNSEDAIQFIGQGKACDTINDLPPADIILITTPDDNIQKCCELLSQTDNLKENSIVTHCSGLLPSDILHSVKQKHCHVASIHPMRSFADPHISIQEYAGTYCAVEGDEEAIKIISPLFKSIESITFNIDKNTKHMYHAAGVIASNYLVTLYNTALQCLQEIDVENEIAHGLIANIMQSTLNNLTTTRSPDASLTGPIQRGDIGTIEKHLESLSTIKLDSLYKTLGLATLEIAQLPEQQKNKLSKILAETG